MTAVQLMFVFSCLVLTACTVHAQYTFRAIVKDAHHGEALAGVHVGVEGTNIGAFSNTKKRKYEETERRYNNRINIPNP